MVLPVADLVARGDKWLPMTLAAVAVATTLLWKLKTASSSSTDLPSPDSTLPLLGNTIDTMKHQRLRVFDWFAEESLKHGGKAWQLCIIGRPRGIVVSLPDHFEDVLKTHVEIFVRGSLSSYLMRDFFGYGILAVDHDEWFFQRKTASHLFSLQMMKDVMSDVIREKIALFDTVLTAHCNDPHKCKDPLSFRRAITHFTSDVFAKVGFGVELDCLKRTLDGDDENAFVAAFSYCSHVIQRRLQQPIWLWRLKRFLNIGDEKKFKEGMKVIDDLVYTIISKSVAAKNAGALEKSKDLISLFLESNVDEAKAKKWREEHAESSELSQLRDMALNFIFAGKDTTSNSMSWFIVMMNRYPAIAQKIRDEIRAKAPSLMTGKLQVPTLEDLKDLTYLEATIRENLRLNPPVAATSRTALETTTLRDGTVIRAGDRVILSPYASARMPNVWGEDASEFKPERWIDPTTGELISVSPFKFVPFLAGPRVCIGRKFAMLEMKIALAVLMARYEFTSVEDPWSLTYEIAITCPVDGPFMVNVKPLVQS